MKDARTSGRTGTSGAAASSRSRGRTGRLAADYGPLAAEYLLPGTAHSRATLSMTARDAVRLIDRLDESASMQPGTKAIADALAREIDEVGDGGILALVGNNTD